MSAPSPLAPGGPVVRAWRHHLGAFDLARSVALHAGAVPRGAGLAPRGAARPATVEELARLDGAAPSAAGTPALEVLSTPALLRDHFWSLDPDELPSGAGSRPTAAWEGFAADVRAFLDHVRAPVAASGALLLTVRDPAEAPPLFTSGAGRALLEREASPSGAGGPGLAALHLNLGEGPSRLIVWSVPLAAMARLLAEEEGGAPPAGGLALLTRFAARFPGCPLLSLTLAPGEGVLVPCVGLAHDFDATGGSDLDVTLSVVPGPGA